MVSQFQADIPRFSTTRVPRRPFTLGKCFSFPRRLWDWLLYYKVSSAPNSLVEPDKLSSRQYLPHLGRFLSEFPGELGFGIFPKCLYPPRAESNLWRFLFYTGNQKLSELSHRTFPDLWILRAWRSCFPLIISWSRSPRNMCVFHYNSTVSRISDNSVGYSAYIRTQHQRLPVRIYCSLHHFTVGLIHSISLFSN